MFEIILHPTYYNQGFFNVSVLHAALFGENNTEIKIQLGENSSNIIIGLINRDANINQSPRIMGRVQLANWFQDNFNLHDVVNVEILSPESIKLT